MLKTRCMPYQWWIGKIRDGEPFTFTRYGDGELNAMFWMPRKKGGGRTKNGDGHTLRNSALRDLLRKTVTQPGSAPNYYRSLWMNKDCVPMERLAREHLEKISPRGVTWWNALAIQARLNKGQGHSFFQAMRNMDVPIVVIGPKHLRHIDEVGCFDYAGFVQVPYKRAFFARERIIEEALSFPEPCYYSIHAGPPSPIIAWELWKERGNTCKILDLGSILDGFVSVKFGGPVQGGAPITRKHWKRRCTLEIIKRNLTGAK